MVVGIALAAGGWVFLPDDGGVVGFVVLTVQKILLSAVGAAFIALGLAIAWGRIGAAIDPAGGHLILVRRVLVWEHTERLPLGSIRRVELRGGESARGRHPARIEIQLADEGRRPTLGLGYTDAALRRLVAWIRDHSGLSPEVFVGLDADDGPRLVAPEPPALERALERIERSRRVAVDRGDGWLTLDLRPGGWSVAAAARVSFGLGAAVFVSIFWRGAIERGITGLLLLVLGLLSSVPLVLVLSGLYVARNQIRLTVRDGRLIAERRPLLRWCRDTIPATEIGDIRVTYAGGGHARNALVVLDREDAVRLTLTHPSLARRRDEWEDIAVVLRASLAAAQAKCA